MLRGDRGRRAVGWKMKSKHNSWRIEEEAICNINRVSDDYARHVLGFKSLTERQRRVHTQNHVGFEHTACQCKRVHTHKHTRMYGLG